MGVSARSPLVSAVILNWNGGEIVVRCLRSILRQSYPAVQPIVVDNGSTDGSLGALQREVAAIRVIRNDRNLGFAAAANQGIAAAQGEWVLLANLDVDLEPDYVARLVAAAERDPRIGSVTGKLLRLPTKDSAGARILDSTGHVLYRNGWTANRGEQLEDHGQWDRPGEVFGVSAAAALYRTKMLQEVTHGCAKPFDECFFAYIEDVDLDWRARWLGWKAWYEPALGWHHRGASGMRREAGMLRHLLKNRLLLVANNDLWPGGLRRLPGVLLFTTMVAVQFGLESPLALRGILDFLRLLPATRERRRFLRAHRRVGPEEISRWMHPFPYARMISRRLSRNQIRAADAR